MAEMSEKERAQKKLLLRGLENLSELGGFIKEQIEDSIYELYPSIVVSKTENYCPLGPGFWNVADSVELAVKNTGKYVVYEFDEKGEPYVVSDSEFEEWLIDQVARIETEKIRKEKGSFWLEWKLSRETKRVLMNLNALDERILFLSSGIGNGEKLDAIQIAALPEFSCSEEYINCVMDVIDRTINHCEWGNNEFNQVCDEHRSR